MQDNPEVAGHREEDPDDLAMVLNRIEILDYLDAEGNRLLVCSATDGHGNRTPLIELLGALELSKDTFLSQYMGRDGNDGVDQSEFTRPPWEMDDEADDDDDTDK